MSDLRSQIISSRKKKIGPSDLDITSLLDVIVTLLFFLIQFSDIAGFKPTLTKGITPPNSQSKDVNHVNTIIQANDSLIYVDDKVLASTAEEIKYGPDGKTILPLFDELVKKREAVQLLEKSSPEAEKFTGAINLIVDKSVKYSFVRQLLYTASQAGFGTYQLVVIGEPQ